MLLLIRPFLVYIHNCNATHFANEYIYPLVAQIKRFLVK